MRRLLIYCHFNRSGDFSEHVRYQIQKLSANCSKTIFVSNSPMGESSRADVLSHCDEFIQRENKGYDFAAWKEVLQKLGLDEIGKYDALVLSNDTCFGPLQDMERIFATMDSRGCDFWGITSHAEMDSGMPIDNGPIPYHLQSYFLVFYNNVLKHPAFADFWENVEQEVEVEQVIKKYESQLTRVLEQVGFKSGCWIETGGRQLPNPNYATWCPDFALVEGSPFLKVKAIERFQNPQYLKQKVRETSTYPVALIEEYVDRNFSPNESAFINSKTLPIAEEPIEAGLTGMVEGVRVGIHIHVFYIDVLERILDALKKPYSRYYFFFSTGTEEKRGEVMGLLNRIGMPQNGFEVGVFTNRGRDIYPWLQLGKQLAKFPIACHLHTKKTAWASTWVGESWMDQIINELVKPAEQIIGFLERNPKVGIVIPDVPIAYQGSLGQVDTWGSNRARIRDLWERMGCSRPLRWEDLSIPIMPFGSMFWYRPEALQPLMDLGFGASDFPEEPLAPDGALGHAIERLPVYLAWERGYDFRIARWDLDKASFLEHVIRSERQQSGKIYRLERQLSLIQNSVTWRVRTRVVTGIKALLGRLKN